MSKLITDVCRLLESRRGRLVRWAGAALIVSLLHVGGAALGLIHWHEEEADDDVAGAVTVELAPLPAPARVDSEAAAHGPEADAAVMAPEASKEAVVEVQEDIPLVEPARSPAPEVVLPKRQPDKKEQPKEEAKEAAPDKEKPPVEEAPELTTRPPRVEAQPAPSSAPSPGQSATLARLEANWAKTLMAKLERHKRYPEAASRRGVRGVVVVRFKVDRSGHVVSSEIMKGSGSPILDEEALAVVKRASPFPVPPDQITDPFLESFLPIWFGMKPK